MSDLSYVDEVSGKTIKGFLNQAVKTDIRYILVKLATRVLNWQFKTQRDFF